MPKYEGELIVVSSEVVYFEVDAENEHQARLLVNKGLFKETNRSLLDETDRFIDLIYQKEIDNA